MEFAGEVVADFLGVTDSKYQYVVDAYVRQQERLQEEKMERDRARALREAQDVADLEATEAGTRSPSEHSVSRTQVPSSLQTEAFQPGAYDRLPRMYTPAASSSGPQVAPAFHDVPLTPSGSGSGVPPPSAVRSVLVSRVALTSSSTAVKPVEQPYSTAYLQHSGGVDNASFELGNSDSIESLANYRNENEATSGTQPATSNGAVSAASIL